VADDRMAAVPEFTDQEPLPSGLIPAERLALTVARRQLERGDNPPPNITTVLVMAIDRLLAAQPPESTVTEWEVRNGEFVIGKYFGDSPEDGVREVVRQWRRSGVPASLHRRQAIPWTEVPEPAEDEDS
jgi:hypothetical protein